MAGADLLKSFYLYVNPYKVSTMIVSLLGKFQAHDLTKMTRYSDILKVALFIEIAHIRFGSVKASIF